MGEPPPNRDPVKDPPVQWGPVSPLGLARGFGPGLPAPARGNPRKLLQRRCKPPGSLAAFSLWTDVSSKSV
jgi:hypothetical protein